MKNLVHTPCQLVLRDAEYGHSLVAVFHELRLQFPPETVIPPNAVIPREWSVFSKWELEEDEEGKDYTSATEIFWPDGTPFLKTELKASPPVSNGMAFIFRFGVFPMGQIGTIRISNTLSEGGRLVSGPIETAIRLRHQFDLPAAPTPEST